MAGYERAGCALILAVVVAACTAEAPLDSARSPSASEGVGVEAVEEKAPTAPRPRPVELRARGLVGGAPEPQSWEWQGGRGRHVPEILDDLHGGDSEAERVLLDAGFAAPGERKPADEELAPESSASTMGREQDGPDSSADGMEGP